jgi:hypothetical protein
MSSANFVRVAAITKDSIILDSLYKFCTTIAVRHYNVKDSLFNSNCSDTSHVRDSYWGRGCGWGVMAQGRILQMLPRGHYSAPWYKEKLRAVLYRLLRLQNQTDGMWRSDLINHPEWNKEASSTAFFAFGYFYAIRNAIIDSATFIGPAKKAWKGLLDCIGVDPAQPNLIGWSQGVGGSASNNFGITNHDEYTDGGFFLAANEFYRLLTEGVDHGQTGVAPLTRSPAANSFLTMKAVHTVCNVTGINRITIPSHAKGIEVFSCAGRFLCRISNLAPGTTSVAVPAVALQSKGTVIIRYIY